MRVTVCAIAAGLAIALPQTVAAQQTVSAGPVTASEEQVEVARQLLETGFPEETRAPSMLAVAELMFEQIVAASPVPMRDPRITPVIERFQQRIMETTARTLDIHMADLMEGLAIAYAETFTAAELEALAAFAATDAGRGVLTRITQANTHPAFAAANQEYVSDYMAQLPALQAQFANELVAAMAGDGKDR